MRVKMKSIYAGPGGNYQPGDLAEFPAKEAKALVAGGYAEDVSPKERRASSAPETATTPGGGVTKAGADQNAATTAPEKAAY